MAKQRAEAKEGRLVWNGQVHWRDWSRALLRWTPDDRSEMCEVFLNFTMVEAVAALFLCFEVGDDSRAVDVC